MKLDEVGRDRGFQLGVLDALLAADAVDRDALEERLADLGEAEFDLDPDDDWGEIEQRRLGAALARLADLEVSPDALAAITRLEFGGDADIYMLIEMTLDVDTGGESDDYLVGDLAGLCHLPALEHLDLDGHGFSEDGHDLEPLEGCPALRWLRLTGAIRGADALLELPALEMVDARLARVDDAVLDALAARDVTVQRR